MEIKSVKIQGECYLVNESIGVPRDNSNLEYKLIKEWLDEGNIPDPEFTEVELQAQAKAEVERIKEDTLARLTVTITSGKVFYADLASKLDIETAIRIAIKKGITEQEWKLAQAINGTQYVVVTLAELEEASYLALNTKGTLVGVIL